MSANTGPEYKPFSSTDFLTPEGLPLSTLGEKVIKFFRDNNAIHLGFAFGGSILHNEQKNNKYSDIDTNVIIEESNLSKLLEKLQKDPMAIGTYFDSVSPYPVLHSLVLINNRIYRWDIFVFVPGGPLPIGDPFRTIPIAIIEDRNDLFNNFSINRIPEQVGTPFEDHHLHIIDWLFYLWNKTMRNIPVEEKNIALLNDILSKYSPIGLELTYHDTISPQSLFAFVRVLVNRKEFQQDCSEKNLYILDRVLDQMENDLQGG